MTMRRDGATPSGSPEPAPSLSAGELGAQEVIGLPERQVLSYASAYFILFWSAAPAASLIPNGWVPDPDTLGAQDSADPAAPTTTPAAAMNVAQVQNAAIARNVLAPGSFTVAHQIQYAPVEQPPASVEPTPIP